jgi:hypothetical protein
MSMIQAWSRVAFAVAVMVSSASGQTADDPGEGLRIEATGTPNVRAVKWWGRTGRTYFVQSNPTLNPNTWSYMPVVESGTSAVHSWNLSTTGQRMFVRLVYTDQLFSGSASLADFDGDGLTNAQEVASSGPPSNPLNSDTDDDGFSDSVEWGGGYSPVNGSSNPDYNGGSYKLRANRTYLSARHVVSQPVLGVQTFTLRKSYSNIPGFTSQPVQSYPERPQLPALPAVPNFYAVSFNGWSIFDPYSDNPLASGYHHDLEYNVVEEAEYDYTWAQLRLEANFASTRPRIAWLRLDGTGAGGGGQQYITAVLPPGLTQTSDFAVQTAQVVSSSAEISVGAAGVQQLEIRRDPDELSGTGVTNFLPMSGSNLKALPGQWIHLKVHVGTLPVGVYFNNFEWTLPEKVFKDYTASQTNGTLTQMSVGDKQGVSCSFYFADSGTKSIQVNFQVNGVAQTLNTTITVEKPSSDLTANIGATALNIGAGLIALLPANGTSYGIDYSGTVTMPTGWPQGKWNWVQIVTPSRALTKDDGSEKVYSLNGEQVLDTTFPYAPLPLGSHPGNAGSYQTNTTNQAHDMPDNGLAGSKLVSINAEAFQTYVMFLPPGAASRYVPLRKLAWEWSGAASKLDEVWSLVNADQSSGTSVETSHHPEWAKNVTSGFFKPVP